MRLIFLIFFYLIQMPQAFSFGYDLSDKSISDENRIALETLFSKATSILPVKLKRSIPKNIKVKISDLNARKEGAVALYQFGTIYLDRSLIPEILRGEARATPTKRTHKTLYNEILASVLHETTHAYDFQNVHSAEEKELIRYCQNSNSIEGSPLDTDIETQRKCLPYLYMNRSFSQNPYFLLISGFQKDHTSWLKHRSPDTYELTGPEEFFAVNMEYFLLDPDYPCRRPTLARLLKSHFQHDPFPGVRCQGSLTYIIPNSKENDHFKTLDLSRVYRVHYLLADTGESLVSGWGHAMFHLVICSPERKAVGPECMKDVNEHIVLSYRAFVNSLQISTLKGLNGSYPSRLFFIPLSQVIDEYNKTEMRDLKSIPLNLTRQELEQFVIRALEVHWSYDGKYYFISNNCATESFNLLKSAVWRPGLIQAEVKTPKHLESELLKRHITYDMSSLFSNRLKAIGEAYLFDSYRSRYEMSFAVLKNNLKLPYKDFMNFLELSAKARALLYKNISQLKGHDRLKSAAAVLLLETAAHRRTMNLIYARVQSLVMKDYKSSQKTKRKSRAVEMAESLHEINKSFALPASFLGNSPGYGLPSKKDFPVLEEQTSKRQSQKALIYKEAESQLLQVITLAQRLELRQIKENTNLGLSFIKP